MAVIGTLATLRVGIPILFLFLSTLVDVAAVENRTQTRKGNGSI